MIPRGVYKNNKKRIRYILKQNQYSPRPQPICLAGFIVILSYMGMQKFHITLPDLEFTLPSKSKIEANLLLMQLRYYYHNEIKQSQDKNSLHHNE